jgi:hypothetical protein
VNQTDEIYLVGHGRQLSADGLQAEEESAVHARGCSLPPDHPRQKRKFLLCRKGEVPILR